MHLRISLAVIAIAGTTAYAQPKKAAPAPKPVAADDLAEFDKQLDALFVKSGLTAEQAAVRAARTSPTVRRKLEEVQATIAQAEPSSFSACRRCWGGSSTTRFVAARLDHL